MVNRSRAVESKENKAVQFILYLHELCRINEVVLQHLLSETTHGAVKLICCLTVLNPPGERERERGGKRNENRERRGAE